jgi:hypothetical protein
VSTDQDDIILRPGIRLCDVVDVMTVLTQMLYDRSLDALITDELQAASSELGYTTSARSASAAKASAA